MTAIAGLLLLGLVYFVVGQAGVLRGSAQTAADAAALAAAQDAREQLRERWLDNILEPASWVPILSGEGYEVDLACQQAAIFATQNGAGLWEEGCEPLLSERLGFRVTVRTQDTVGPSVVPVSASTHAVARAEAVLEPRCRFKEPDPSAESPAPPGDPQDAPEDLPGEEGAIVGLVCNGVPWEIDPERPVLPDAADLFTVRLTN